VDLKYITSSQIIEIVYEGEPHRLSVASISPRSSADGSKKSIADGFQALSIHAPSQLWQVGWDSTVSITDDPIHHEAIPINKVPSF